MVLSVDRSDYLVGRDSHSGSRYRPAGSRYSLDNLRRADRGSRPDCDSRPGLCQNNRDGTGRNPLTLRDSRASNAPPVIDRSDVLGLPAVEHHRGSPRYSESEPCHSHSHTLRGTRTCAGHNRQQSD